MAEMTLESLRRTVLRAEIMALLHDVGKLHWYFIQAGTTDSQKMRKGRKRLQAPTSSFCKKRALKKRNGYGMRKPAQRTSRKNCSTMPRRQPSIQRNSWHEISGRMTR